jgi:hypothetical protein
MAIASPRTVRRCSAVRHPGRSPSVLVTFSPSSQRSAFALQVLLDLAR